MLLAPKRTKHRKYFKGRIHGMATQGNFIAFGDYGLKSLEPFLFTARQIEAGRRALARKTKRMGKIWVRAFPDKSLTKKPAEVRMGSGKGSHDQWVSKVKPGKVLFEVSGLPYELAVEALTLVASKLPVRTKIVSKRDYE